MKSKKTQRKTGALRPSVKRNIATNLVLGTLVLSIGTLCIAPFDDTTTAGGADAEIYRSAISEPVGVSLMFNVYWGTEEVYQILDILQAYNAKCTFFIGGCWADDNVECLREIYARGHEIGNHGYFHKEHDKLSLVQNQKEISDCNRFIELAIGVVPTLFAPPSGAYSNDTLSACKALNMKTVLWSRDTIDWRDKDKDLIYTRATKNIQNGEFVLMHPMEATVDALGDILTFYQSKSLIAVTVGDNLHIQG